MAIWKDGEMEVVDAHTLEKVAIGPGSSPRWSPAGDWILFTYMRTAYVSRADGSERRQVGEGPAVGWSPSGDRYAWWRRKEEGGGWPVIYIDDLAGDRVQEIELGDRAYGVLGWWSIGIAYSTVEGWGILTHQRQWVSVLDPDSGQRWRAGRCEPSSAAFSPPARRFAYRYVQPEDSDPPPEDWVPDRGLFVHELDGVRWKIGNNLNGHGLSWSPDGQRLAFWFEQRVFLAEGDSLQQIRPLAEGCCPHWHPDGGRILYGTSQGWEYLYPDAATGIRPSTWGAIKNLHR